MFYHKIFFCVALFANLWIEARSLTRNCFSDYFGVREVSRNVHFVLELPVNPPQIHDNVMKIPEGCSVKGVTARVCTKRENVKVVVRVTSLFEVFITSIKPFPVDLTLYCLNNPDSSQAPEIPELKIIYQAPLAGRESDVKSVPVVNVSNAEDQAKVPTVPQDVISITVVPAANVSSIEDQVNVTVVPQDVISTTVVPAANISNVEDQANVTIVPLDEVSITVIPKVNVSNSKDQLNLTEIHPDVANFTSFLETKLNDVKNEANVTNVLPDAANVKTCPLCNIKNRANLTKVLKNGGKVKLSIFDKPGDLGNRISFTKDLQLIPSVTYLEDSSSENVEDRVNVTEVPQDVVNVINLAGVTPDNIQDQLNVTKVYKNVTEVSSKDTYISFSRYGK